MSEKSTSHEEAQEKKEDQPEIQEAWASVTGYGSPRPGSPPADKHVVAYRYREVKRGVLQAVLREGTPWTLDGKPIQEDQLPAHWRAEVRLPDEEHGWTWAEEDYVEK